MDNLWWLKVPDALTLISYISKSLLNEKNIMIYHQYRIPWRNTLVQEVQENVRENNSSKGFEMVQDILNPGKYLLNGYCKVEKRATYRPTKGYANFFAESDDIVIHNKYFWVLINSHEEMEAWMNFVTEYYRLRPAEKESATFLLEYSGNIVPQKRKGIEFLNIDDYINDYDKIVFATLIVADLPESVLLKKYLTELIVCLANTDIEFGARLNNGQSF